MYSARAVITSRAIRVRTANRRALHQPRASATGNRSRHRTVDVLLKPVLAGRLRRLRTARKNFSSFLPERAKQYSRERLIGGHRGLGAKATAFFFHFASFIYFSSLDNKYVNNFANIDRLRRARRFGADFLNIAVKRAWWAIKSGYTWRVGAEHYPSTRWGAVRIRASDRALTSALTILDRKQTMAENWLAATTAWPSTCVRRKYSMLYSLRHAFVQ